MRFSITPKISVAILCIVALSISLTLVLNFFKFDRLYNSVVQSRFVVMAQDIRATVEFGLNLGLGLNELRNTQDVIDRTRERDTSIVALRVFDDRGRIQFSSPPADIGEDVPDSWLVTFGRADGMITELEDDRDYTVSVPLLNAFDQEVGGLALSYSKSAVAAAKEQMLLRLAYIFGYAMAAFGLLTLVLVSFVARPLTASLERMDDALHALVASEGGDGTDRSRSELERQFKPFLSRADQVIAALSGKRRQGRESKVEELQAGEVQVADAGREPAVAGDATGRADGVLR